MKVKITLKGKKDTNQEGEVLTIINDVLDPLNGVIHHPISSDWEISKVEAYGKPDKSILKEIYFQYFESNDWKYINDITMEDNNITIFSNNCGLLIGKAGGRVNELKEKIYETTGRAVEIHFKEPNLFKNLC